MTETDLTLQRGNTEAVMLQLMLSDEVPFDLTGEAIVFRATLRGVELFRFSSENAAELQINDAPTGFVTMVLDPEQTRMVPDGRLVRYEFERRADGEQTILAGYLIGAGGINDDEAA